MKANLKVFVLLLSALLIFATPSFAAAPGQLPKPGIYKSKCGVITVSQVLKKESKFFFSLEASDCKMNSGNIEKASMQQFCSDECTWVLQYDEFPECRFWLDVKRDTIEIRGNDDPTTCGFGNRVTANGKYKLAK